MWFLGAVLGAVLAAQVHSELWIVGALLGGLSGWSVGSRARHRAEERFRVIDERLQRLEATLQRLEHPMLGREQASEAGGRPGRTGPAVQEDHRNAPGIPALLHIKNMGLLDSKTELGIRLDFGIEAEHAKNSWEPSKRNDFRHS